MIEVEVNGVVYSNFPEVRVNRSMETISGTFQAVSTIDKFGNYPLKLQDSVRILVEGVPVITGFIEEIAPSYASDHIITISGRDKTADVIDSSVKSAFNLSPLKGSVTLKSAIEKLLSGNGIDIKVIDLASPAAFKAGDTLDAEVGQNMFEVIDKYCKKRQVLATTDGNGNIVITRGGKTLLDRKLIHRDTNLTAQDVSKTLGPEFPIDTRQNDILRATAFYSTTDRFNLYEIDSQMNLNSVNLAKIGISVSDVVSQGGSATDPEIRASRFFSIGSDTSNDTETSINRAVWEANVRRSRGFSYSCDVQGFLASEDQIWSPNFLVEVQDEKADISSQLLIKSVAYDYSSQGSITSLSMGYKDSFSLNSKLDTIDARSNKFGVNI